MNYRFLADLVEFTHAAYMLVTAAILISGAASRSFFLMRTVSSLLLIAPISYLVFGGCPLTLLENSLRSKYDQTLVKDSFSGHYLEKYFGIHVGPESIFWIFCGIVVVSLAATFFFSRNLSTASFAIDTGD